MCLVGRLSGGYETESIVSRLEREERAITLAVAVACETLFGAKPAEMFPALIEGVEEKVLLRMHELHERLLQSKVSQKTAAKLKLLREAIDRVTASLQSPQL